MHGCGISLRNNISHSAMIEHSDRTYNDFGIITVSIRENHSDNPQNSVHEINEKRVWENGPKRQGLEAVSPWRRPLSMHFDQLAYQVFSLLLLFCALRTSQIPTHITMEPKNAHEAWAVWRAGITLRGNTQRWALEALPSQPSGPTVSFTRLTIDRDDFVLIGRP